MHAGAGDDLYVFDWIHRYDDDRELLGKGAALIRCAKKRCGLGGELDLSLGHEDAAYVGRRFDAMEVRVPDAPGAGEIMVVIITDSGRPLPRVGGHGRDQGRGRTALKRRTELGPRTPEGSLIRA
ncbi:hypothetical protein ACVJBD_001758 [Rhizobium mongolense]